MTTEPYDNNRERARRLGLWGLIAHWDKIRDAEWIETLLEFEELERGHRSLRRRLKTARLGRYKSMAEFDWGWPTEIDRQAVDRLFEFGFMEEVANVVFIGPNGVAKTMIAKNLAHQAVLRGNTVLFATASDMLADLTAQETASARRRRLQRYVRPKLLVIDEIGYLSYDNTHADLLFEVVNRRYENGPIVLTTNKIFGDWNQIFPNASCVVTLVDRLVHHSEIVQIKAESYRLKEAQERAAERKSRRNKRKR